MPLGVPAAEILFGHVWREAGYATMILAAEATAGTITSFSSEVLKADGAPRAADRVHIVLFICSAVAMLALLPFGLYGVCAGVSIGSCCASLYSLRQVRTRSRVASRGFFRETLPPLAGLAADGGDPDPGRVPLRPGRYPGHRGRPAADLAEGVAGVVIFTAAMLVLAPGSIREMRDLLATMIRRRRAT